MIELVAAAEIVLAFDGLKDQGQVLVVLFDSEAAYKARKGAIRDLSLPVRAGRAEVAIPNLKPGAYAAMAFHDLNGDRRMNFRLGLPAEPYAVSNNAKGFPIAGWSAAKFQVGDGQTRQTIRLK